MLDPEPPLWPALYNRAGDHPNALATRRALGLPTDRPVVMSGHQGVFWHPGILAKRLMLGVLSEYADAGSAWLVVDQDTPDPWTLEVPTLGDRLGVRTVRLCEQQGDEVTPLCARSAVMPRMPDLPESLPSVRHGLERTIATLHRHSSQPNAAHQIAAATTDLLQDRVPSLFASELNATPVFGRLIQRMRSDPQACARMYNDAVALHGGARALLSRGTDWELPLWQIGRTRQTVYASMLDDLPPEHLAPKALLMTAMLRLEACDLFIHGLGGGASESDQGYDRATEAWIGSWLGEPLAPAVVVSADLRLPLMQGPLPDPDAAERAVHTAQSARHNPGLVGDHERARAKTDLVDRIRASTDRVQRHRLFATLQRLLSEHRESNAARLADLRDQVHQVRARVEDAKVAARRDWSWVLHDPGSIEALRETVRRTAQGKVAR